jgi:hypothetical protein
VRVGLTWAARGLPHRRTFVLGNYGMYTEPLRYLLQRAVRVQLADHPAALAALVKALQALTADAALRELLHDGAC